MHAPLLLIESDDGTWAECPDDLPTARRTCEVLHAEGATLPLYVYRGDANTAVFLLDKTDRLSFRYGQVF